MFIVVYHKSMETRKELKNFIISEIKLKRPDEAYRAEKIAEHILSMPCMQSESGIKGFLKGYFDD